VPGVVLKHEPRTRQAGDRTADLEEHRHSVGSPVGRTVDRGIAATTAGACMGAGPSAAAAPARAGLAAAATTGPAAARPARAGFAAAATPATASHQQKTTRTNRDDNAWYTHFRSPYARQRCAV